MRGMFFRIFPGFCQNISTVNVQILIFLNNFKCKGMFLSLSFDVLLSCRSRDVFNGFLARSVQELQLIKFLPATTLVSAGVKGF